MATDVKASAPMELPMPAYAPALPMPPPLVNGVKRACKRPAESGEGGGGAPAMMTKVVKENEVILPNGKKGRIRPSKRVTICTYRDACELDDNGNNTRVVWRVCAKACRRDGVWKLLIPNNFPANRENWSGLDGRCKACKRKKAAGSLPKPVVVSQLLHTSPPIPSFGDSVVVVAGVPSTSPVSMQISTPNLLLSSIEAENKKVEDRIKQLDVNHNAYKASIEAAANKLAENRAKLKEAEARTDNFKEFELSITKKLGLSVPMDTSAS